MTSQQPKIGFNSTRSGVDEEIGMLREERSGRNEIMTVPFQVNKSSNVNSERNNGDSSGDGTVLEEQPSRRLTVSGYEGMKGRLIRFSK
jgi:hypothetical protein